MTGGLPGPSGPGPGTIAVALPYWRTPDTVRAAVEAVLGQTYTDLRLYVVNDGDTVTPPWPLLSDIRDPRLARVDLPVNRGRYFCDAAVLAAVDTPWFAIHDADDVADPDWLQELVTAAHTGGCSAAFAPQRVVELDGRLHIEPTAYVMEAVTRLRYIAHHAAVYRTADLRAVGGPHPAFRIGYDTLMVNLVALYGPVGVVDRPLYTRHIRPNSLTTHPATARGSTTRRTVRRDLERMWARAWSHGITAAVHTTVTPELAADVAAAAAAIRTTAPPHTPETDLL